MNYQIPFVFTFILVVSFHASHSHEHTEPENYEPTFLPGVNQFSSEFVKSVAKNRNGNFVSSPIGALTLMGIIGYGTEGHTRDELDKAMHSPISRGNILMNYRKMLMNINSAKGVELHLANKLFIGDQHEMEWIFKHVTDVIFQATTEKIDFHDTSKAAGVMNNWVKQQTQNKINEIVKAADLEGTTLMLAGAAYFKGTWVNSFNSEPENKPFNLDQTNSVTIPMMCNYIQYNHGSLLDGTARYVEIEYETKNSSDRVSMYIIVSDGINGLDAVNEKLPQINFAGLNGPKENVKLCLPKFKIGSELDLIPALQDMGIHDLFSNSANLQNMGNNNNLKVTNVKQKAYLSVDENGTEAAATSVIGVGNKATNSFTVDRPFYSVIVSKTTGTPLIWARITDPRSLSA